MGFLIRHGTVVSTKGRRQLDVRITADKITEMGVDLPEKGDEVVDAAGCLLFPGFIDTHTHLELNNGPGTLNSSDDFTTGTIAAVAKGTTFVMDMATPMRGQSLQDCLTTWDNFAEDNSSCDYSYHMSVIEWQDDMPAQIKAMAAQGITSFKMYMAYDNLRVSDAGIFEAMKAIKSVHGMLGIHCENGDLADELQAQFLSEGKTSPKYHPLSRPNVLEAEAINRYLTIAALVDLPVNIVHLSTKEGLEVVRAARKRGQKVFVESCPQYFLLNDELYNLPNFEGAKYVCAPPLRQPADIKALWGALTNGEINTIGTDHCDFNFATEKVLGKDDFSKIPGGLPGIETRGELMYTYGVAAGRITPEQFVGIMSEHAAHQFGLFPQKGVIQVGSDADIVIWDPNTTGVISAKTQLQNVDYTAYEGFPTQGSAQQVYLRGQKVAAYGQVINGQKGEKIARHASEYDFEL
ncbi:phenylhydantoinase [Agrilactobacillus composti DSM 18527 = JCM 14202]|uniref:Phenylhydantoinase n=1 Tax=Agrilactobacillus composti DSM 18527 = JCM 14202 TaxID=1423734 RepID=X0PCN6_9LACO|nr:dihydropyrimidinase [Agrilactobacillus composti]KRM30631.1 phenylhydantoinase [Agrilactobacillus composti DSM 18527 = JCM 14202]GAF38278.1 dihydropyrimidinase [Agrilactobacillus composti DSM 18527 = JCM 14202]